MLYLFIQQMLKHIKKAAVYTFLIVLLMLSFGALHDGIKLTGFIFLARYLVLLPVLLLLTVAVYTGIRKSKSNFSKPFFFINTLLFLLLGYEIVDSGIQWRAYNKGQHLIDNRFAAYQQAKQTAPIADTAKPDIYFLVFDAMPSTIAMQQEWGFNNQQLDDWLKSEGFYVSSQSRSNYNLTVLSVSSMLNMDYSPPVDLLQDETKMYFKASASILDNSLTRFLKTRQYTIKQYQAISFKNSDWGGGLVFGDMLYMNYFYQTLPGRIYRDIGFNFTNLLEKLFPGHMIAKTEKRNKQLQHDLLRTQELIKQSCAKEKKQPQLIYAHFQLPHDPFIFDSSGKRKSAEKTMHYTEKQEPAAFIEQVLFSNRIIADLVLHIKKHNRKKSIIVVTGDHGYRNINGTRGYMIFDNFSALYFPDQDSSMLYPSMSPVNNFRIVLNKYFNTELPLLKDSSIFIPYTLPGAQ